MKLKKMTKAALFSFLRKHKKGLATGGFVLFWLGLIALFSPAVAAGVLTGVSFIASAVYVIGLWADV